MKSLFSHFLLLSISILSGEPYTAIHVRNIAFMSVFLFFFGIIVATECLVQPSIRCNIMCPWQVHGNHLLELVSHWEGHYWKQWGILQILHTEQFYVLFLMSLFRLLFSGHCLPELLTKAKSLSSEECANVWWSFVAISLFDFSSVDLNTLWWWG